MPSHAHVPGCARLNVMRLNAARLNYAEPVFFAVIGDVERSGNVRIEGAAVEHVLNDQPDTAAVRVHGFVPSAGQSFALYTGDRTASRQLFGGRVLETTVLYESKKDNVAYDLHAIDPTWLLNRQRVLAKYENIGPYYIIQDIVARYTRGVTINNVMLPGLTPIEAISFTNETVAACLTAVCERIGAYWYLDYTGDLHAYLSEGPDANPITDANPRGASDLQLSEDLSQVVTRVIARGGSGQTLVDVPLGATEIPVSDDGWFSDVGGAIEVAGQRLHYYGVRGRGGKGALIGVSIAPTSPPFVTAASGAGLPAGTYKYALTFANASGESLPSAQASIVLGGTAPGLFPTTVRPGYYADYQGKTTGGDYSWAIQLVYASGGLALGAGTPRVVVNDRRYEIYVGSVAQDPVSGFFYYTGLMSGTPAEILQTIIFRTLDGGTIWYREKISSGVVSVAGGWLDTANQLTDAQIVLQPPYQTTPVASFNQARISQLQTLPAGFTTRKLYRTAVNGSQLKLLATNPADPYLDTAADATLGANVPTTDTSGVVASGSQTVVVGATTIPVTDTAAFVADGGSAGGWATIGRLPIKYGGLSSTALTGLPATGVGAVTSEVRHGAAILVQPRLHTVSGMTRAIPAGETVTIRIEVEDTVAQAALASRLAAPSTLDGIVEEVFSDSRMTLAELSNYAKALLLERKDPRQTLRFVTRDTSVRVGKLITVTTAKPPINGTFRVQKISFDEIAITGGWARTEPRRTVEASNKLYTFADLLRRLRGREGGAG